MNKRDMKPIAYEIAARILERALYNGEYAEMSSMDEVQTEADEKRLAECIEEITASLDRRAARKPAAGK